MARTRSRPPGIHRVRTTDPSGVSTARHTVPTGLAALPPPGPAMPVMPMPTSAPLRARMPGRHRRRDRLADRAVGLDQPRVHAQQVDLRPVAVADDAAGQIIRGASHLGEARHQQAAGARLCRRQQPSPLAQRVADDVLDRSPGVAVDIVSKGRHRRARRRIEHTSGLGLGPRPRRQVQIDRSARGENRDFDGRRVRGPRLVERPDRLFGMRFGPAEHPQNASVETVAADPARKAIAHLAVQHRQQLPRRPRQQHDHLLAVLDPQPGRSPVDVGDHHSAFGHHRLPAVDLRHRQLPTGESRANGVGDGRILAKRPTEHLGRDVPCQVVISRAETAAQHDQIGPGERAAQDRRDLGSPIADDGLRAHFDAEPVEPFGDRERVRVDPRGRQQLGSDGDDFRGPQRPHQSRARDGTASSAARSTRFP